MVRYMFKLRFRNFALLSAVMLLLLLFSQFGESSETSLNGVRCLEIEDEALYFGESSGVTLPEDAQILLSCDDHSSFHWDGEYYFVFDTSPEEARAYLETSLWNENWQEGPVPEVIQRRTGLSDWAEGRFNSTEVWYVAENRSPGASDFYERWWNGRAMIIDPENGRVFYTVWDF